MNTSEQKELIKLAERENWEIEYFANNYKIIAEGKEFPLCHPYIIHLKLYADSKDAVQKFHHMKAAHDFLWPEHVITWNYWTERRFLAHCEGWKHITMASGAGCGKSIDAAKIALIFWLSNFSRNACIISSTTLESLETRIWGYVAKLLRMTKLPLPAKLLTGKPPKVVNPITKDKIHGMFAVAVKKGEAENTLSTIIGRHPDYGLMLILDEATDIPPAVIQSIPNLEQGTQFFQIFSIGNSRSKDDLHGAFATPKNGWESINPEKDFIWETVHDKGICLYFNPHDSPAIHEKDPVRKQALSRFLITEEGIKHKQEQYGTESDAYYRFVLGFWKSQSIDERIVSEQFLSEQEVSHMSEWAGIKPLNIVAGLDPAFAVGGTGCLLRLAVFGQSTSGLMVLDFRQEELMFRISIIPSVEKSSELQLAEQVLTILQKYNITINNLAIDITGSGRALGELIKVLSGQPYDPIKVNLSNTFVRNRKTKLDPFIFQSSPTELWFTMREFIQHRQIKGLDNITVEQFANRKLITNKTGKSLLESKVDYKMRMTAKNPRLAHSPDEADAATLALQVAVRNFGFHLNQRAKLPSPKDPLWVQKTIVYGQQQEKEKRNETYPLIPNFSGTIEDLIN